MGEGNVFEKNDSGGEGKLAVFGNQYFCAGSIFYFKLAIVAVKPDIADFVPGLVANLALIGRFDLDFA